MFSLKGASKAREPKTIEVQTTRSGLVHWEASEPNQEHPVDTAGWKRFDFVDKKGKMHRSYAADVYHAKMDICTRCHLKLSEDDLKLISK